jgi:molecular chaperone GrpE
VVTIGERKKMAKRINKHMAEEKKTTSTSDSNNEDAIKKGESAEAAPTKEKEELEGEGSATVAAGGVEEVEVLKEKVSNLEKELGKKDKTIEDYFKQILRLTAEFENFRRRSEKEKEDRFLQGKLEVIKNVISLVDVFESAAKMISNSVSNENTPIVEGFKLIYKEFMNFLFKEGVKEINPINCKFDFWYHEVVESVEREDVEEDTVVEVIQKGYMYRDKVIRPAKVKIAKSTKKEIMH